MKYHMREFVFCLELLEVYGCCCDVSFRVYECQLKSLFEFAFVPIVVGDFCSICILAGLPIFLNDKSITLKTQLLDFIITITFSFGIFLSIYSFFAWLLKKEQFHFSD
jgi:hypothetical protein